MNLTVKNIYGIESANVTIPTGPTLVTGKNSTGKTSLARILAALLSHDANPSHISATESKHYIKDGATDGYADLEGVRWSPKVGISVPRQQRPHCTPYSVGLIDFNSPRSGKARQAVWEALFLPQNAKELLEPNWTLPVKQLDAVLETIERTGDWNEALKYYEDKRREWKSMWRSVTGRAWGAKVATSWTPANWSPDLDGASKEQLYAEVTDARDAYSALMARTAISASQIQDAEIVRDTHLPNARKALEQMQEKATKLNLLASEKRSKMQTERNKIEKGERWMQKTRAVLDAVPPYHCPHCNEGIEFRQGQVVPWVKPTGEELEKTRAKYEEIKAEVEGIRKACNEMQNDLTSIEKRHQDAAEDANEQKGRIKVLEQQAALADRVEVPELAEGEQTKAETLLGKCRERLEAFEKRALAQQYHDNVCKTDEVCEILGPNGVRAVHIQECMDKIRAVLKQIKRVTGWYPIEVTDDYQITSNGRPVQLCAKNEQLKAQWAMQFACAFYSRDTWIVLDEADTLKDESWAGLIRMVNALCDKNPQIRIIVCATSSQVEEWNEIYLS